MNIASDVATIVQLVQFGIDVLTRIKDYIDSEDGAPKVFRDIAIQLPLHKEDLNCLKQSLNSRSASSTDMENVIKGYTNKLADLSNILEKVIPQLNTSIRRRVLAGVYSFARDKKVSSMWKSVHEYRSTLM